MGCDIHSFVEKNNKSTGKWAFSYKKVFTKTDALPKVKHPFSYCDYSVFAFLAGVRNYAMIPPISKCRRFAPNMSKQGKAFKKTAGRKYAIHHPSWLTAKELIEFDYDTVIENRYIRVQKSYGTDAGSCKKGLGKKTTYREFLGKHYFVNLNELKALVGDKAEEFRVVFWFDN